MRQTHAAGARLRQQQSRYHVAGNDEKYVDADESTRNQRSVRMKCYDEKHCDSPQSIDVSTIAHTIGCHDSLDSH